MFDTGCTVNALRHRIARIKKKVANDENLINTGQSSSGAHGTGVAKRKRGCAPKVAPTKLKQAISSDEDDKEDLVFKDESEAEEGDKGKKAKVDIDEYEIFDCSIR
jgi:hypothetical protein